MIVFRGCWAQLRPELQALYPALAAADRPATVEEWLNKSAAPVRPRPDPARRPARRPGDLAGQPTGHPPRRRGDFVRWARKQELTGLDFAATRWSAPAGVIDTEARWEQARRLLHDGMLKSEGRVAGLLVLLYAQRPATISQLTFGHVQPAGDQVRIRLGCEPAVLPEPLGALVLQLVASRRGHAAIGDQASRPGCSPAASRTAHQRFPHE